MGTAATEFVLKYVWHLDITVMHKNDKLDQFKL